MSGFFSNRVKLPVHLFQLALIVGVLIVSVVRMLNQPKNAPRGRSTTMALGMVCHLLRSIQKTVANSVLGCQVAHHYPIRNPIRSCASFQEVVKSQGLCYPQRTGDCLLGSGGVYDDSSKHQVLWGHELHAQLDCCCHGHCHEVCSKHEPVKKLD